MSPKFTSLRRFFRSPIWVCEFTIPSSNNSLYAFSNPGSSNLVALILPTPDIFHPFLNALPNILGSSNPSVNIPLAAANAPALIKLRKCVGIDKTVLANWAVAFGNNTKFLYKKLAPFSATVAPSLPLTAAVKYPSVKPLARFKPSAISFVV